MITTEIALIAETLKKRNDAPLILNLRLAETQRLNWSKPRYELTQPR